MKPYLKCAVIGLCVGLLCCVSGVAFAEESSESNKSSHWPRFRGAQASGVAPDHAQLPDTWNKTDNVKWSVDLAGWGWSCPVVWGDCVFLTAVVAEEENTVPQKGLYLGEGVRDPSNGVHHWMVHCFDLETGSERWRHEAHTGEPIVPRHPKSTYAVETATTDGQRLYVLFGDLGLYCYDLEGELLWSQEIEPKKTLSDYGAAASPIVHEGQVIMVYDNQEESFIAAFDAKTGQENWRQPRGETSTWATPFLWENRHRTEIVVCGRRKNRSYDLVGKLLWEFDGEMSGLVIPSPFASHGLLFITSGYVGDRHRPVFAIRPGASGDFSLQEGETSNEFIQWYQPKAGPYNPSPIVYGDYYYTLYDRGFLTCHDALTGKEVYGKQRFAPGASFTSSPWAYNGKLFCLSEDGDTYVVAAGAEFKLLHTNPLGELCLSSPAVSGGNVLIRTAGKLYCLTKEAGR